MLHSGGQEIDSRGIDAGVSQKICQLGNIFIDPVKLWFNHKFCGIEGYGRMPDGTHQ